MTLSVVMVAAFPIISGGIPNVLTALAIIVTTFPTVVTGT